MMSRAYSPREAWDSASTTADLPEQPAEQGNPLRGIMIASVLGGGLWAVILSMIF